MAIEQFSKITYNDIDKLKNTSIETNSLTVNGDIKCAGKIDSKFTRDSIYYTKRAIATYVTPNDGTSVYKFATLKVGGTNHPLSIIFTFVGLSCATSRVYASLNSKSTGLSYYIRQSLYSTYNVGDFYYKYDGKIDSKFTFSFYVAFYGWKRTALADILHDFDTSEEYDTVVGIMCEYIGTSVPEGCTLATNA